MRSPPDDDVRELIRILCEDRATAEAAAKREGWTKYVSLMVVTLAVATAIGSLKAGGFASRVVLNQAQASNAWAYYQAKSIKQRITELESRVVAGEVGTQLRDDVERYKREEAELRTRAEAFEAARDAAARHGPPLGFAIAVLQISIALASVTLITRRKPLWYASGLMSSLGSAYLVYGLYLV
jgi:hypothetical protein